MISHETNNEQWEELQSAAFLIVTLFIAAAAGLVGLGVALAKWVL